MKKLLVLLLALPALALGSPVNVQKDSATNQLLYSGFKVPTGDTIELQSGSTFLIDSGATFTFPTGSVLWSSISGTPTTLSGYGITNGQILNANLTAISGLSSSANTIPYFTGSGTAALNNFTAIGQALAAATSAASAQSTLALVPGTNVQAFSTPLTQISSGTWAGAASITTLGTIGTGTWQGSPINLASYASGILPGGNGGTGNGFFAVTGPTGSLATFTFPTTSATVLTSANLVTPAQGGDGVNNAGSTETRGGNVVFSGAFSSTFTLTNNTAVTFPITGTLATLSNAEALTNKTIDGLTPLALTTGFSIAGGTTSKTLTVSNTLTLAGTDSSTLNIGAGGTLGSAAFTSSGAYQTPLTFTTGLTNTVGTVTVNASQVISTLSNLTGNGVIQTSGGTGALSINTPTGSGAVVEATAPTIAGGSISALTNLGIRDTSAAFDVVLGATSSTTLTANRALTFDVGNVARTLKFTGNAVVNQDVSTTGAPTFGATTVTNLSLGATTPGVIAGANGAISLTGAGTNQAITLAPSGTGGVVFNVGAVATPIITFAGDTSTGLYHPAAAQIGFAISGLSVGYVAGNGLNAINIGATTPGTGSFTSLAASGNATVGGTLGVTGATTLAAVSATTGTFSSTVSGAGITNLFASPPALGGTAANSGAFTTLSATGVITSTQTTGTAPFTVASTTVVGNLNVSQLLGGTWASPGAIGGTSAAAGNFTTLGISSTLTVSGSGAVNLGSGTTTVGNLSSAYYVATAAQPGVNTANRAVIDEFSGAMRLFSYGPDASTLGAFALTAQHSDGTGSTNVLTSDTSGNATFAKNLSVPGTSTLTGNVMVGAGGTALRSSLSINGGAGNNLGANINFQTNSAIQSYIGTAQSILGGTSNDLIIYAPSGNQVVVWSGGATALTLDTSQNATFAGNVTVGSATATTPMFTVQGIGGVTGQGSLLTFIEGTTALGYVGNQNAVINGTTNNFAIASNTGFAMNFYTNGGTLALSLSTAQLAQWGAAEADKFTNLTYSATISVNPALGNTFETTTVNATGNSTINFLNAGTAGQQVKLIIINDATSGKTMTWGTNLRPASSTLVGVASKASTIVFQSDGTSFFELSRETGNL